MNRKSRTVLGILVILVLLSTIGLLVLPRLFSPDSGEITLEGSEVTTGGIGFLRYRVVLPAGTALVSGYRHSPTDADTFEELRASSFRGWALQERRTLRLGNVEDLYTRMKESPEFWRRSLERSLLLEPGKPYPLRKGEQLALFQVPGSTVYFELR